MTTKIKRESWFEAGQLLLTEIGPHSLTIDGLCRKLGVTKGSFYHHFKNRNTYIEELWKYWERENTTRLVDVTQVGDVKERLDTLLNLIYKVPRELELAFRALALYDVESRVFQEKIDSERKCYLEKLNGNFFHNSDEVKIISAVDYAWYLGTQLMVPSPNENGLKEIITCYQRMKQAYLKTAGKEENNEDRK